MKKAYGMLLLALVSAGCQSTEKQAFTIQNSVLNTERQVVKTSPVLVRETATGQAILSTRYEKGRFEFSPEWVLEKQDLAIFSDQLNQYLQQSHTDTTKEKIRLDSVGLVNVFHSKDFISFQTLLEGDFIFTKQEAKKLLKKLKQI